MIPLTLCLLLQNPPGPPPGQGPFNDEIWFATSRDGLAFEVRRGAVRSHASVPDLVRLGRECPAGAVGTLLVYYVDFEGRPGPGEEGLSTISSTDGGETWSEPRRCRLRDKPNRGAAVDPSVVPLDDGRLRLYFFGSETTRGDPARAEGPHRIHSATSGDGVEFTCEEGVRYEQEGITDPEVIRAGDEWLMFVSAGRSTYAARSRDGMAFERDPGFDLREGGVPGAVALPDGRVRVYACGRDGIMSAVWDPRSGDAPREERGGRVERGGYRIAADPAVVALPEGGYAMIFKRQR